MVYQQTVTEEILSLEQHDLCHDTKTQIAWIGRRHGEIRCFLEEKNYPHRVKASYLDNSPN